MAILVFLLVDLQRSTFPAAGDSSRPQDAGVELNRGGAQEFLGSFPVKQSNIGIKKDCRDFIGIL